MARAAGKLLALALPLLSGCGNDPAPPMEPETRGSIQVTTSTSGAELDSDGYTMSVTSSSGSSSRSIGVNDEVTLEDLNPGDYSVELAGLQLNCQVAGQNPRMLSVQAGDTTETTFEIGCLPTGSLRVIAETAGEDLPNGYTITAGGIVRALAANGNETVDGLPEGLIDVELSAVASNCEVEGSNPRNVTVVAGSTVETTFSVACGPSIWATKALMPTLRLGLATAAVDGLVYAIGGFQAAQGSGLTTVEAYDPVTDTWTPKASMPTGRRWLTAVTVNGKI
jgi:hypothetical protein